MLSIEPIVYQRTYASSIGCCTSTPAFAPLPFLDVVRYLEEGEERGGLGFGCLLGLTGSQAKSLRC